MELSCAAGRICDDARWCETADAGRICDDARRRAVLRLGMAGAGAGAGARDVKKGEEAMPGAGVMMMLVVLAMLLLRREAMP